MEASHCSATPSRRAESALTCRSTFRPEIERKIERLLILADQPVLSGRSPQLRCSTRLPRACERDAALCEEVRALSRVGFTRTAGISYASLTACGDLGRRYAAAESSRHELAKRLRGAAVRVLAAGATTSSLTRRRAGVRRRDDADGHRRSIGLEFAQLDVGYRDRRWSPFQDSAMLLQHASRDDAVGDDLELRAAHASEASLRSFSRGDERIAPTSRFEGGTTVGNAAVRRDCICRSSRSPGWSLGVSAHHAVRRRRARQTRSASLLDAFFNPSDNDNTGTDGGLRQPSRLVHVAVRCSATRSARRVLRVRRRRHVDVRAISARQHARCRPASHVPTLGEQFVCHVRAQ